ncbi:MAG: S26 family signal peptidase [Candidatus Thermoplasmatota archaeon]|nr:S26 family signal peptidase [Candidatus Thermoplasmatota archaeon]
MRIQGDSMWPTFRDGDHLQAIKGSTAEPGDIVVAKHPWKTIHIVKRVKEISPSGYFLEGDNPDPTGSEDSHNFGPVPISSIIAIINDPHPLLLRLDGET